MTATAEQTRLELLQAKEAELAIEVNAARARIALYPEQLHEARSRAIYAKPNVRPGAELNGEVAKITARERKDVTALNGLQGDLSAVRSVIAEEAARLALEEKAEALKQLELLHEQEAAVWAKAGELLESMATVWNSYVAQVEQSHQFASANGLESSDARALFLGRVRLGNSSTCFSRPPRMRRFALSHIPSSLWTPGSTVGVTRTVATLAARPMTPASSAAGLWKHADASMRGTFCPRCSRPEKHHPRVTAQLGERSDESPLFPVRARGRCPAS